MVVSLWVFLSVASFHVSICSDIFNPRVLSVSSLESVREKQNVQSHRPLPLNDFQYHGTTTLAFVFRDSVIVAVDSMASVGSYVGSRTVRKVFPVGERVIATMAGGAADCAYWIRHTATQVKRLEYQCSSSLRTGVYAKLLASSMREYRGSDISLGTMVAGWHPDTGPECEILLYTLFHVSIS